MNDSTAAGKTTNTESFEILLVHPHLSLARSGVADVVAISATKLSERGKKVAVFTASPARVNVPSGVALFEFGPDWGVSSIDKLFQTSRSNRNALVSIHWTAAEVGNGFFSSCLVVAVLGMKLMGRQVHLSAHELWRPWRGPAHWPFALFSRTLSAVLVLLCSRTHVPVQSWARFLQRLYFFKASSIRWVPMGATVLPRQRIASSSERHQYPLVLIFNPLSTSKNPQLVEAAWARLAQKAPQTRCAVIGKIPPRSDTRLKYLSQHPECQMLGVLRSTEISDWMSRAVALLAPFDEGVSAGRTSVITALAHGLPVVTTAGPATESIWKHTEGVILVNRNPGDLADALMRLHLDENYWEKAAKEARAFYLAHFEWEKILDQAYPEFVQAKTIKQRFQAASLKSR